VREPLIWLGVPDTDLDLAAVRARLVLASIVEGSASRAADELARFVKLHANARGWLGGRETNYVEALSALLAESARWARQAPSRDWPTFAGSPTRNGVAPKPADMAGVVWRIPLVEGPAKGRAVASQGGGLGRVAEDPQRPLGFFPVVVGNRAFVNRGNREILALDLATGRPAWGKTAVIFRDDTEEDLAKDSRLAEPLGIARFTATVFNDRLYARMGPAITSRRHDAPASRDDGYLVCLDLAGEGKLAWKATPDSGWAFEGSPVADATSVYVAMRRGEVQPQVYVASLDARSGQVRWRQFLCAADTPARGAMAEITHNLVTLHRDTLYVNTNMGAVASMNTWDGRLRWVSLYPCDVKGDLAKPPGHASRDMTPCLYDRGSLFVAPADARSVFAIDAASGHFLWQSGPELDDVVHLLGVSGDLLIASGRRLYWIALKGPEQGRLRHVWPDGAASLGYGRGVLAGDCVLWPTREKIYVCDQATGRPKKVIDLPPRDVTGGNLLVAGERLLIATPDELVALGETAGQTGGPAPIARWQRPAGGGSVACSHDAKRRVSMGTVVKSAMPTLGFAE
jgi:outer membrane protein assembly factor BamB